MTERTLHDAVILGGARTPIGRYGGSLSHIRTDDLLGVGDDAGLRALGRERREQVQEIAAGCVNVAHEGMGDIARWAALAAGFPDHVPAYTVNRFCASSLTATISLAHAIGAGEISLGLAAGVESMSRSGWALMKGDAPFMPRGPVFMLDTMWAGAGGPPNPALLARDAYIEMIQTAQNLATRYEIRARGDRRVRAALAPQRRRGPRQRPLGQGDLLGRGAGRTQGRDAELRARRVDPRRHDPREARRAAAAAGHREHDGRQLEPALRRRERRRARERRSCEAARRDADRARPRLRCRRRRPDDHGHRPRLRAPARDRAGRADRPIRSTSTRSTRRSPPRSSRCSASSARRRASRSRTTG